MRSVSKVYSHGQEKNPQSYNEFRSDQPTSYERETICGRFKREKNLKVLNIIAQRSS